MQIRATARMRAVAAVIMMAIVTPSPIAFAATNLAAPSGSVSGNATDQNDQPLAAYSVRLRNVDTGIVDATSSTNTAGEYAFTQIASGKYVVELLDRDGYILALSAVVTIGEDRKDVAGLIVRAKPRYVAAGATGHKWFGTTAMVLTAAAAAGVTAGVLVSRPDASPSKKD